MVNLFEHYRTRFIEPNVAALGYRRCRVALTTALSFDISVSSLLWMVAGHALHVISDEVRRDPERFVAICARGSVSINLASRRPLPSSWYWPGCLRRMARARPSWR